jgi:hypothetical protein
MVRERRPRGAGAIVAPPVARWPRDAGVARAELLPPAAPGVSAGDGVAAPILPGPAGVAVGQTAAPAPSAPTGSGALTAGASVAAPIRRPPGRTFHAGAAGARF